MTTRCVLAVAAFAALGRADAATRPSQFPEYLSNRETGTVVASPLPSTPGPTACIADQPAPTFTDAERAEVLAYWSTPGRYEVSLPHDAPTAGVWKVRLTPDGSKWLLAYQRAVGAAKLPPTVDAAGSTPATAGWERWVAAKVAMDRYIAQQAADRLNRLASSDAAAGGGSAGASSFPLRRPALTSRITAAQGTAPDAPGLIPPDLLAAVGDAPAFANVVAPLQYTIVFDDGERLAYTDNVPMRPRYAYYRFPQGTAAYGTPLKQMADADIDALFSAAGLTPSEQRVEKAVSRLEGGFDAVNTYDTGYVSVGFLQFAAMGDGRGSLAELLHREKAETPDDFARDFRRYGIDLAADGSLAVVDPATGAELTGPTAVMKLIDDKRFAAVFQRAGLHSRAFRVAQIRQAKAAYWPADDPLTVTVAGVVLIGKVSDVIHSEAGMAALFDRKVNRGSLAPLPDVVTRVMTAHSVATFADLVPYEREIVAGVRYRTDFLADPTLGQPK